MTFENTFPEYITRNKPQNRTAAGRTITGVSEKTKNRINWLVVSTLFLTSYTFFRFPFEFYLFYVPIIILFPYFIKHVKFSKHLLFFYLIVGLFSLYGVAMGLNTMSSFLKIYISIVVVYSFYYYAVAFNGFNVLDLFKKYLVLARIVAIIGLLQFGFFLVGFEPGYNFRWILNKWSFTPTESYYRVNSIISEPSQLAFVLAPALFVSIYNVLSKKKYFISTFSSFLFILTTLLTFSTHAYIVLLFSALFVLARRFNVIKSVVFVTILSVAMIFVYNNFKVVRARVDDSILIVKDIDKIDQWRFLSKLNPSSFTLLNNSIISLKSFESSPLVGSGLGSHPVSFDKYSITRQRRVPFQDFNVNDANSLFLRLLSELGLLGVSIIIFVVIRYRVKNSANDLSWVISHSILVMLLAALIREGHYFLSGVPLFIFMYIYLKEYPLKRSS